MTCYTINIEVNDGVSSANFIEEENCDLVNDELNSRDVKITAYEIDNDGVIVGIVNNVKNVLDWTNKNILLIAEAVYGPTSNVFFESNGTTIRPKGSSLLNSTIEVGTVLDVDNYSNAIVVKASLFLDTYYTVGLFDGNGTKTADVRVRIDKEPPIINFNYKTEWTNSDKIEVEFTGSDGKGSGFEHFEICVSSVCDIVIEAKDGEKKEYSLDNGTYEVYGVDKVGNRSRLKDLKIDKVDKEGADSISLVPDTTLWVKNVTLIGTARDDRSGLVGYQFSENSDTPSSWNNINLTNEDIRYTKNVTENKVYYFHVKDVLGNSSFASYEVTNIDKKIDVLKLTPYVENENLKLRINITDSQSGIKKYVLSTSSSKPTSGWTEFATPVENVSESISVSSNGTWYLWAVDDIGNEDSTSYKVDIRTKSITLESEVDSRISGSLGVSAKYVIEASVDNGVVSSSLTGTNVNVVVSGGNANIGHENRTFQESPNITNATVTSYCTYYCSRGGSVSGSMCVGSDRTEWGDWHTATCWCGASKKYSCYGSASSSCSDGYKKNGMIDGSCTYSPSSQGAGASCSVVDEETSPSRRCQMNCTWKGNYNATCSLNTDYTCNVGTYKNGYCYSCNNGSLNSYNICTYTRYVSYTYYKYNVSVKYLAS